MDRTETEMKSLCCHAPVVGHHEALPLGGYMKWHECTKCGKACDAL